MPITKQELANFIINGLLILVVFILVVKSFFDPDIIEKIIFGVID